MQTSNQAENRIECQLSLLFMKLSVNTIGDTRALSGWRFNLQLDILHVCFKFLKLFQQGCLSAGKGRAPGSHGCVQDPRF